MSWFERHLNWTSIGIVILSLALFFFFIWLSLSFNFIYWEFTLDLSLINVFILVLVTLCWLMVTAIGYGWVLYKKNRSSAFLFFFLPALITIIRCLFYKLFFFSNIEYGEVIQNGVIDFVRSSDLPPITIPRTKS
jgi:hypothetical protein